jgi:hypothetical protein
MRSTVRRLSVVTGSVLLAVLALAGPALAAAGLGTLHGGRGAVVVAPSTLSPTTADVVWGSFAALAVIGLFAWAALVVDRRSSARAEAAGASEVPADVACDEVACEFHPRQDESQERKAA